MLVQWHFRNLASYLLFLFMYHLSIKWIRLRLNQQLIYPQQLILQQFLLLLSLQIFLYTNLSLLRIDVNLMWIRRNFVLHRSNVVLLLLVMKLIQTILVLPWIHMIVVDH